VFNGFETIETAITAFVTVAS